ncbi:MAG: hypothetical protein QM747_13385 [Nocardioides sp.]
MARRLAQPCGECQSCKWIAAGQHPDVTQLSPEGDSTQITIQPVRDLAADLALTAHAKGYKVAIVCAGRRDESVRGERVAEDARGAAVTARWCCS